jgi:hypothetical protein
MHKHFVANHGMLLICLCLLIFMLGDITFLNPLMNLIVIVLLLGVHIASVIMHEIGHALVLRVYGYTAKINLLSQPKVFGVNIPNNTARLTAIAGPLLGAISGFIMVVLIMTFLDLKNYYYLLGLIYFGSHMSMLLPQFADGSIVFNKVKGEDYA